MGGAIVGGYWQERPVEVSAKTGETTRGIDINIRLTEKVPQKE